MANDGKIYNLFGFEIKRAKGLGKEDKKLPSIVPPVDNDGAGYVTGAAGAHYGHFINYDGDTDAKDNAQLINKYRGVALHPEVDAAIEDIVNEAITASESKSPVDLVLEATKIPSSIKKKMEEEFRKIVSMLNFNDLGHDIFRSWYVDGRLYHHLVVDESNLKLGIQEIRPIDSAKIRKVKHVGKEKDPKTGAEIVKTIEEFYIYQTKPGAQNTGIKLSPDSVSYVTSGLLDDTRKKVISFIHKALKPINQLRMMEDSLVIYRLARAPERRIFYIDVGNLPRGKAEQYMKDIMARYRNKLVYDANTGEIKDDRKHMAALEDFWLPRREGGRGTEITTLPGGENLGQIDDIVYFQKKLYRSLNVPLQRLEQEAQFSLGRSTEINRDEIKFQKFIDRLRNRFSALFLGILKKQLLLKGVITEDDWLEWKEDIIVDWARDNHFVELINMDILREKLQTMDQITQYVGEYYSKNWVMKNVLGLTDEETKKMNREIQSEPPSGDDMDDDGPAPAPKQKAETEVGDGGEPKSIQRPTGPKAGAAAFRPKTPRNSDPK
jgi:hypothetical protein|tara:strand:- start:1440 stop:3092 length:1653 start_codon:yes stop_codon:yes gene_type:complete